MVFGFRTQYGGGKSTGFALIYDSAAQLKQFEPHYRLVRIGVATKVEKASRQQRTYIIMGSILGERMVYWGYVDGQWADLRFADRQATQESIQGSAGYGEDEGSRQG